MNATTTMDRRSMLRGSVTIAGVGVALPTFASLSGCSSAPPSLEGRMALLGALADRVIPETDTPGAISAKVPQYIAAVFDQHLTEEQQADFAEGLASLDELASGGFANASPEEQDRLLRELEQSGKSAPGYATWRQAREMTIFGFYTSEEATQELAYEEIPGRYQGCVQLSEVGRAWLERGV